MQMKNIFMLLILTFSTITFAQNNINYFKIERAGNNLLSSGDFDGAKAVFESYRIATSEKYPDLENKITNIVRFTEFHKEAERLFDNGKYYQSIEKFKKYREFFPKLSIRQIDNKIELCIKKIEQENNFKSLEDKNKVIIGFEKNYLAEKALEDGQFERAKSLYISAIEIVKSIKEKNSVKEQANLRISQINICLSILKNIEVSNDKIRLYESYRSNGGIVVKPFENKIAVLRIEKDNQIPLDTDNIENLLIKISNNCDMNTLINYVSSISSNKFKTASKDTIYQRLYRLNNDLIEIRSIKNEGDPSQKLRFVFGGYETLIFESEKIPIVGRNINICLRKEYHAYLSSYAQRNLDYERDLNVARDLAIASKQYATSKVELELTDELIKKISNRIGCENIIKDQLLMINTIEANLNNCLLDVAKNNFQKVLVSIEGGCVSPLLDNKVSSIRERIKTLEFKLARIISLKNGIIYQLNSLSCNNAERDLSELENIETCNKNEITFFINQTTKDINDCKRKVQFKTQLSLVKNKLYDISILNNITSLKNAKLEIKNAKNDLQNIKKIATQNEEFQINQVNEKIKELEDKYLLIKNRYYLKIFKPELYFASLYLSPKLSFGDNNIKTVPTYLSNYEIGINLRTLKREKSIGSIIGLHYLTNDFQILNSAGNLSEQVKAEYLSGEFKLTTGFKKNSHPYIGIGIGINYPIRVKYYDITNNTNEIGNYFKNNKYVNPHGFLGAFIGYESHRKNIGFSVEGFVRISGFLENENTKRTDSPVLNISNFKFSNSNANHYNSSALTIGLATTFHLW